MASSPPRNEPTMVVSQAPDAGNDSGATTAETTQIVINPKESFSLDDGGQTTRTSFRIFNSEDQPITVSSNVQDFKDSGTKRWAVRGSAGFGIHDVENDDDDDNDGPVSRTNERTPLIHGQKGMRGDPGPRGEEGPRGEQGPRGDQGFRGVRGERGLRGEPGPQGPAGPRDPTPSPATMPQKSMSKPQQTYRSLIGISPHGFDTSPQQRSLFDRITTNHPHHTGCYAKILSRTTRARLSYNLTTSFMHLGVITELAVAATIIILTALPTPHRLALVILAGTNMVLAGLLSYMKARGLPATFGQDLADFSEIRAHAEFVDLQFGEGLLPARSADGNVNANANGGRHTSEPDGTAGAEEALRQANIVMRMYDAAAKATLQRDASVFARSSAAEQGRAGVLGEGNGKGLGGEMAARAVDSTLAAVVVAAEGVGGGRVAEADRQKGVEGVGKT